MFHCGTFYRRRKHCRRRVCIRLETLNEPVDWGRLLERALHRDTRVCASLAR